MASCLLDFAKKYVEKLIDGAISESRYICCYTSIAGDFEKEKETLEAERTAVEQKVNVAKRGGEDILRNVTSWQEQADKLMQEDTKTKLTCFFGWCPNCKRRYKRGKELEIKTGEIKQLITKSATFEVVGIAHNLPGVEYYSSQHYISFESRKVKYKDLLDALSDDNNYIIGLQGMGGTGKTTLAKQVGKELQQSKQFDLVIDTTVSYTPDIKKIQDEIAGPLELKSWKDYGESERHKRLWSRLTNGEKILLILDDVWGDINLEEIGVPCRDNHKGCRVLVTTRNQRVCNSLGCEKTIQLELLSEEDAWNLFKEHAGITDGVSKRLLEKGREIVKECKGLPVAIAAVAASLKGEQRQEEWDAALISLRKSMPVHGIEKELVDFYKCLWHSYDRLENEEAKRLFLLCSLFPEDEEIPIETLARLGIAAGLFGEIEDKKYNDARTQVLVAKNKLIDSCLLLSAEEKKVKMHDLVRDVALWIANKEIQQINLSNKNHKSMVDEREKDIEYLLCEGKGKDLFSCRVNGSKLKVLLLNVDKDADGDRDNPLEIPNSFFENLTTLQAFHLSSIKVWGKPAPALSLPESVQSLANIRSLTLKRVELGDISILRNLQSLGTLEFIKCTLAELPHEISELGNLRLLNLHRCEFGRNDPFKVIERCKSLEELYFVDAYGSKAIIGSENQKNIILDTLQRYRICQAFANDQDKYSSVSKYVGLEEIDVFFSEATFKYLVKTAETLWLRRMKGTWKNLMPEIISIDEGMTDLVELILESCSQMKCLIIDINPHVLNVFPKLVALTLKEMENLQGMLFKSNMNLCNLKTMKLHKCPKLESLFQVKTSQGLPLLEVIEISECGQLKYIFGQHQLDEHDEGKGLHKHKVKEDILGSLREISLKDSPKFIDIFEERNDPMCCSERRLSSRDDSKSKSKSTTNKRKMFPWSNLSCCYDGSRSTTMSTATEITPAVSNSKDQLHLASKNSTNLQYAECLSRQWHMMCNIKKITIWGVAKLKSLFILSTVAPTMLLLESLEVESCDELKHIIAEDSSDGNDSKWSNVFPKLKELTVSKCGELEYVIGEFPPHPDPHHNHDSNNTQIHIQLLPALTTLQFERLPKLMGICSSTSYRATLPLLRDVQFKGCPQYTMKELSGNGNNFFALEFLYVTNSKAENIVCVGDQQRMDSRLKMITLNDLPDMKYLFMGPKNFLLTLGNLRFLTIARCKKLEVIFSACVARRLPQLESIEISECKELKQIVEEEEDYVEACLFPKLRRLVVEKCNKLKCVFPAVSTSSKELPKLEHLIIKGAMELEQVFLLSVEQKKVELPNLKLAVLVELPSLICPGIQFQLQTHLFVHKCPKLISPTSSNTLTTLDELKQLALQAQLSLYSTSYFLLRDIVRELEYSRIQDTGDENSIVERAEEGPVGLEVGADQSGCGLSSSLLNSNVVAAEDAIGDRDSHQISPDGFPKAPIEKSRHHEFSSSLVNSNSSTPGLDIPLHKANSNEGVGSCHSHETFQSVVAIAETYSSGTIVKEHFSNNGNNIGVPEDYKSQTPDIINENLVTEITEDSPIKPQVQATEEGSKSIIRNTSPRPIPASSQKDNIEEITAANVNISEFSTRSKSASSSAGPLYSQEYVDVNHSHGDSKLVAAITEMHAPVSLNDEEASKKANSDVEEQFSNNDEIGVTESKPIPSVDASETRSVPFDESNKLSPTIPSLIASQSPISFEEHEDIMTEKSKSKDKSNEIENAVIEPTEEVQVASGHESEIRNILSTPLQKEDGDGQIAAEKLTTKDVDVSHSQETSTLAVSLAETNAAVSLNHKASTKVSSAVSGLKSSPTICSAATPKTSFVGYPSQGVEDLNVASLITKELEELVSKKYLAYENLSLLTDFLIKHPSVRLTNGSFSNRNKGYAYNCLAELLKFLQTHSVLEVLESSHSDFVELLQDVRKCGFDKDWLDDVERRALFPGFQVSEEAMTKITDSKHILTQHVEDLKHQLESSEAILESIIQQETQVLEARAALRAPIGY